MKKLGNVFLVSLFLGFIFFFGIIIFVMPDKDVSDVENRPLAQLPILKKDSLINGQFRQDFESYITDQFYLRNQWVKGFFNWQVLTNQTFIHDYYIDGEWVYPKPFTSINEEAIQYAANNMTELNQYAMNHNVELFYFSLPDRRHMLDDQYPEWVGGSVGQADKEMLLSLLPDEHMQVIDVGEEWENEFTTPNYKEYYYKTDHHWNMTGAFHAYKVIHKTLHNSSNFVEESFQPQLYEEDCLTDKTFIGVYNKQLYEMMDASDESMCYKYKKTVDYNDWSAYVYGMTEANKHEFTSVYGRAKQMDEEKVSYSDVFVGDFSELHVMNPMRAEEQTKALILKDSYANPLLPLIADNFHQTTYYDVRHNEGRNLYDFISSHDFDVIMVLYSNGRTLEYLYDFKGTGTTSE